MGRTFHTFDVIVIGAGTAGIAALKEARRHTDNVLMIQDGTEGTTCALTGCMPTKALVHAAALYHLRHNFMEAGILGADGLAADIPKIMSRVRQMRDHFIASVKKDMRPLQAYIMNAKATFESPTTVRADGKLMHGKAIIIATGSSPFIPHAYRDYKEHVITSDTLFLHKDLPKRIGVIGLGAMGLEMAQSFARLGIAVTAIHKDEKIGGLHDPEICRDVIHELKQDMKLWMKAKPDISRNGKSLLLRYKDKEAEVDALLVCAGRTPNLSALRLKRIGVPLDSEGVPHFNPYTMQIPDFPIFLAGDSTDERSVVHEAVDEGTRAGYHAATGDMTRQPRSTPLSVICTDPVIASIGEGNYAVPHRDTVIGEAFFEDQGKAIIEQKNKGRVRIFADKKDGTLRGAEMMAPAGEHLAHLLALAMEKKLTAEKMLAMPFYHPTLEEGIKTALLSIVRQTDRKEAKR